MVKVRNRLLDTDLIIYQDDDWFKFSLDSVLLSKFVTINLRHKRIIDLATGNAPIPLLLSFRTNAEIYGIEYQKCVYDLACESVLENGKNNQINLILGDVKEIKNNFNSDSFDVVTCNPPYFKTKNEPLTVGNPVRRAFAETDREEARKALGIEPDDFAVLSFGGSLGAMKINQEMQIAVENLSAKKNCKIFFVTGKRNFESITEKADMSDGRVTYLPYIDDMPKYLSACDLAVTRSGALTVSEIAACGRASVMIPSPYVTNNHQYFNAKVLADKGGAVVIEEKDLKAGQISEIIQRLIDDREAAAKMSEIAASVGRIDAAEVICDTIGVIEK